TEIYTLSLHDALPILKLLFMFFAITGKATMWQGVFADTGVALLCVLNSLRVLFSRKTEI
ncbi:MAG TPA: hypothetical protein DEA58_06065, partial [Pseudothermotoga sp.]|nr:hypothetical protein [Pseudothermotoga sp.]